MKKLFLILFLSVQIAFAALTESYVQTTGSNLNAGSTTDNAAEFTFTGGNWDADATGTTHVFTAAGADLSGITVGERASVYPDGASVTVYVARITAVDDGADTITLSTTLKAGTAPVDGTGTRTIKVGGAWAGPSGTVAFPWGFVQNTLLDATGEKPIVYFKAGTYAVTGTLGTHANAGIIWEGYQTTPGDWETATAMPIIDGTGGAANSPFIVLTQDGDGNVFRFFHFKGNVPPGTTPGVSAAGVQMIDSTANDCIYERMLFTESWRNGLKVDASGTVVIECEATDCNMDDASDMGGFWATGPSTWIRCKSYNNDAAGAGGDNLGFNFNPGTGELITAIECIASGNSKHGFQAQGASGAVAFFRCVSYGNTDSGFYSNGTGNSLWVIENCISYGNSDYGFLRSTAADGATLIRNNGVGANTAGVSSNIGSEFITDGITLTADPFTDAANGDFTLNSTAGGGALLKNTGRGDFPDLGTVYSGATTSTPNVGATQHTGSGAAGTRVYIGN